MNAFKTRKYIKPSFSSKIHLNVFLAAAGAFLGFANLSLNASSVDFRPSSGDFGINEDVDITVDAVDPMQDQDKSGEACGCNTNPNDVNWSLGSKDASIGGDVTGSGSSGKLQTSSSGDKLVTGMANFHWECSASYPNGDSSTTTHSDNEENHYNVSEYYVSADSSTVGLDQDVEFTFNGPGNPDADSWSSDGTPDSGGAGKTFTTKWTTVGEKSVTANYQGSSYTRPIDVTADALTVSVTPGEKQVLWHEGTKQVTFTASANDTTSTDLVYSWSAENGTLEPSSGNGPTVTVTFADTSPEEGNKCTVTVTRGDGKGGNKAEKTVVVHVVKSYVFASQSSSGNLVTEGGEPLDAEVVTTGIAADQLEYSIGIEASSSNWYNEADSLGNAEQDQNDPTKFKVKAKWFTATEGGCAFSQSSSGSFDVPIPGSGKLKLAVKYNNAEIGTEDQTTFDVQTPTDRNYMEQNPDNSEGIPDYLASVSQPAFYTPTNSYRCEILWNTPWSAKAGVVHVSPAWTLTQYGTKITAEEQFHKGQWEGTQPRSVGGASDLYTRKGTLYLVGMGGNGPFYFYGTTASEAAAPAQEIVDTAFSEERSTCMTLWNNRRRLNEETAKEHAGYTEALTYECTYDLPQLPNNGNDNHPAYE